MSYCKKEGKDTIIFVTEEDHKTPAKLEEAEFSMENLEQEPDLILEDGSINWDCPCLGGMATGPCGYQFREAFSCFHHSEETPKGADCYETFKAMSDCMSSFPALYGSDEEMEEKAAQEDREKQAQQNEQQAQNLQEEFNKNAEEKSW